MSCRNNPYNSSVMPAGVAGVGIGVTEAVGVTVGVAVGVDVTIGVGADVGMNVGAVGSETFPASVTSGSRDRKIVASDSRVF